MKLLQLNKTANKLIRLGEFAPQKANSNMVNSGPEETEQLMQMVMIALSKVATAISQSKGWLTKIKIAVIGVRLIYDIIRLYRK